LSSRRLYQCLRLLLPHRGGSLLLRGDPGKRSNRAHAQGREGTRRYYQEMSRVPERDPHRCPPLRPLHAAGDGTRRITRGLREKKGGPVAALQNSFSLSFYSRSFYSPSSAEGP